MELRKEIKQRKFRNEWLKGIVNIVFTYNWMSEGIKELLKPYGITMQQFNVLRILNGQHPKPITTSVIRERMLNKMSDASRIVERLHKKGLVERFTSSTDRRLVDVTITRKGRILIKKIDKKSDDMDRLLALLTEEEAKELNRLLDKVRG